MSGRDLLSNDGLKPDGAQKQTVDSSSTSSFRSKMSVTFSGVAIWRVENGKLAEGWIERAGLEAYKNLTDA